MPQPARDGCVQSVSGVTAESGRKPELTQVVGISEPEPADSRGYRCLDRAAREPYLRAIARQGTQCVCGWGAGWSRAVPPS